jgi:cytochrome bd-type quinol oxidase subunit 2
MILAPLAEWDNFYVIAGSSAGGLTGLTFVVIALAAEARRVNPVGMRTFISPTIVHFASVLALAAFLCVPRQTLLSVGIGLGIAGVVGLIYVAMITMNFHHNLDDYTPDWEDWTWHVILPAVAYGGLIAMGLLMRERPEAALYGVGAVSIMLLFIGIHNAWDIAVWISLRKQDPPKGEK